jgi:hypothetical protein
LNPSDATVTVFGVANATIARRAAALALAGVWLASGLGAKLLGLVPRHQAIVARFFGDALAWPMTKAIGTAEVVMAVWILSGRERTACAVMQTVAIVAMNSLELWGARDLLLFPRLMPVANAALLAVAFWWARPTAEA